MGLSVAWKKRLVERTLLLLLVRNVERMMRQRAEGIPFGRNVASSGKAEKTKLNGPNCKKLAGKSRR